MTQNQIFLLSLSSLLLFITSCSATSSSTLGSSGMPDAGPITDMSALESSEIHSTNVVQRVSTVEGGLPIPLLNSNLAPDSQVPIKTSSIASHSVSRYCGEGEWAPHPALQGKGYCIDYGHVKSKTLEEASSRTTCGGYYKTQGLYDNEQKMIALIVSNGNCRADDETFPINPPEPLAEHCKKHGGTGEYRWMYYDSVQPFGGYGTTGITCAIMASRTGSDVDGDSILDDHDNCPVTSSSNQLDTDNNGIGGACDTAEDLSIGLVNDKSIAINTNNSFCNDADDCWTKGLLEYRNDNYQGAASYFIKACNYGETKACTGAGDMSIKMNQYKDAEVYLTKSCNLDDEIGCFWLGNLYSDKGNADKGLYFRDKACNLGHIGACIVVGDLYFEEEQYIKSKEYFRKGCFNKESETEYAKAGIAKGCNSLGILYTRGLGVNQDIGEGLELYKKGCDVKSELSNPACENYEDLNKIILEIALSRSSGSDSQSPSYSISIISSSSSAPKCRVEVYTTCRLSTYPCVRVQARRRVCD